MLERSKQEKIEYILDLMTDEEVSLLDLLEYLDHRYHVILQRALKEFK